VSQYPTPPQYPSSYPSPYAPPDPNAGAYYGYYYGNPYDQVLRPPRRAGILMFVLGGLLLLCGLACGGVSLLPLDQLFAQSGRQMPAGVTVNVLRIAYRLMGVLGLIVGLLITVLGIFVRRANKGAIIAAMLVSGMVILGFLFFALAGLVSQGMGGSGEAVLGMGLLLVPVLCFVWLLAWLFQAYRAAGQVGLLQAQYQAQYYQYQQQQMYGGGYAAPAPQQGTQQAQYTPPPGAAPPV
jgi:hypothetical protein